MLKPCKTAISYRRQAVRLITGCALAFGMPDAAIAESLAWINVDATAHWTPRSGHAALVFENKMWILGGRDGEGPKNDVWYSTNGANWTLATATTQWSPREEHSSVVFDNRMWVIGGSGRRNDVWSSSDGIDWNQVTSSAGWTGRSRHSSIVFDNRMWVIGGSDENPDPGKRAHKNDVWYSGDGANWASATLEAPWVGRDDHTSIVLQDRIWVIGGGRMLLGPDDSTGLSDVWSSGDGSDWTRATDTAPWINRVDHSSVVFDGQLWLIGGVFTRGFAGVTIQNDVWSSENGTDWTRTTAVADWAARHGHSSLSYDGKIWVLGGQNQSDKANDVWYSEQGEYTSDVDGDGVVNRRDLLMLMIEWKKTN
jgi:N-acetylneuraminic acid mutarotase